MMADTSQLNGTMIVSKKSTDIPHRRLQQSYGEKRRLSRPRAAPPTRGARKQKSPRNLGGFRGPSL